MRTFYLFKIKNSIRKRLDNSYNLYNALEGIYHLKMDKLPYYYDYFNALRDILNKNDIDNIIYEKYKDRYDYMKVNNVHIINDYFNNEKSKLLIKRNYMCIKSTKSIPTFLKDMRNNSNIFVCDFKTRDYFWLEDLVNMKII